MHSVKWMGALASWNATLRYKSCFMLISPSVCCIIGTTETLSLWLEKRVTPMCSSHVAQGIPEHVTLQAPTSEPDASPQPATTPSPMPAPVPAPASTPDAANPHVCGTWINAQSYRGDFLDSVEVPQLMAEEFCISVCTDVQDCNSVTMVQEQWGPVYHSFKWDNSGPVAQAGSKTYLMCSALVSPETPAPEPAQLQAP
jgi:hypothetical protein